MCDLEDSLERCTMWRETGRTARKRLRCSACGGRIEPGSRYLDHFSVLDGQASSERLCTPCSEDREDFTEEHGGMVIPNPTSFTTVLQECIYEGPEEEARWGPVLQRIKERSAA